MYGNTPKYIARVSLVELHTITEKPSFWLAGPWSLCAHARTISALTQLLYLYVCCSIGYMQETPPLKAGRSLFSLSSYWWPTCLPVGSQSCCKQRLNEYYLWVSLFVAVVRKFGWHQEIWGQCKTSLHQQRSRQCWSSLLKGVTLLGCWNVTCNVES